MMTGPSAPCASFVHSLRAARKTTSRGVLAPGSASISATPLSSTIAPARAAPAGTPAKAKQKLRTATERALNASDVIDSMRQGGFEPGSMPLSEVDGFIKAEYKRWGEVIRAAGIKPQ